MDFTPPADEHPEIVDDGFDPKRGWRTSTAICCGSLVHLLCIPIEILESCCGILCCPCIFCIAAFVNVESSEFHAQHAPRWTHGDYHKQD
eukprot:NODE_3251_length_579_cov_57.660377_g2737_i0.p1 GENE.NODE_3251_length_579_cov_57.660377_g2737_i0~~NODE_3251_length_579_cov_57.660377_g2737_i0.p1  ORF type:complete len:90 (+),score=13.25 NODE_3251_length_579_cov_57.660377_g2737_i0:86-355(+)